MNARHAAKNGLRHYRIPMLVAMSISAVFIAAYFLVGCASVAASTIPTTAPVSAPSAEPAAAPAPEVSPYNSFGDTNVWNDGVTITVGVPVEFTPSATAFDRTGEGTPILFEFTMVNNTDEELSPMVTANVASGGKESGGIFDIGNELGEIGNSPMMTLLPGQSVTWLAGYSVLDISDLTMEIAPSFKHKAVFFTS